MVRILFFLCKKVLNINILKKEEKIENDVLDIPGYRERVPYR